MIYKVEFVVMKKAVNFFQKVILLTLMALTIIPVHATENIYQFSSKLPTEYEKAQVKLDASQFKEAVGYNNEK